MCSLAGASETRALLVFGLVVLACSVVAPASPITQAAVQPLQAELGFAPQRLSLIDAAVESAIERRHLPGAVVLVWHGGETVYHKAFGQRSLIPSSEPMTTDTIFDLASLTKVVATTTALMMLVEEGRVRLRGPVARHLPGFGRRGKEGITVEHLLTHMSGLRPDYPLEEEFDGYDVAIVKAFDEQPVETPGTRFVYSDINFIVLGELVTRLAGMPLDQFAERRVFQPLTARGESRSC